MAGRGARGAAGRWTTLEPPPHEKVPTGDVRLAAHRTHRPRTIVGTIFRTVLYARTCLEHFHPARVWDKRRLMSILTMIDMAVLPGQ